MIHVMDMEIIDRILEIAESKGLKQQELESLCALAKGRVSKWKDGSGEPTATQIARIADALHVPVRTLIDGREEPANLTPEQRHILTMVESLDYQEAVHRLMRGLETQKAQPTPKDRPGQIITHLATIGSNLSPNANPDPKPETKGSRKKPAGQETR